MANETQFDILLRLHEVGISLSCDRSHTLCTIGI